MKLDQIIDLDDLEREVAAGYVSRRHHPEFPDLTILNYTDRAQFDQHWTDTTRRTRGIIHDGTGEILALPFAKFFNYGQGDAQYDLDAPIVGAFDKLDGSLGIGYRAPDGSYRIATRGSFDSEQARHANAWLAANPSVLATAFLEQDLLDGATPLFEIIYPENRIVVDYGSRDELVYLGWVNPRGGHFHPLGGRAEAQTLRDVLALPPRENAEGWVVWLDRTTAVKIKYEKYVELHRAISNMTPKEAWRQLRAGTFDEFAEALPDELHDWAKGIRDELEAEHRVLRELAEGLTRDLLEANLPDRRAQAEWVKAHMTAEYRGFVFGTLDGKDISDSIWRMLEPKAVAA